MVEMKEIVLQLNGQGGLPACERIPRVVEMMVMRAYRLTEIKLNAAWFRCLEAELGSKKLSEEGLTVFGKRYDLQLLYGDVPCEFHFESMCGEGAALVRSSE